ncbi:GNAT family N-acetyltransferase [Oceanirhabdus sp. W0125-5]|uniref:GNAT family N-acetyltransferase n=1 Tax=Oceanirhabdus sp. W0125-5 TaxID=2999116 RepID=UPI0022F2CD82|nr:GNAT family N-acetyltransferase [Oceanirhabdus sp. W0125-5]WBW95172.1 GNAT family N-acetyltransferase [Oceanirhabdus sp. W0125-5]
MKIIREIKKSECIDLAKVAANSYPGSGLGNASVDRINKWLETIVDDRPNERLIGYFDNGKLLGGLRLLNFKMNLRSKIVNAQGIGLVCVDLLHKKERIAKELMEYTLNNAEKEKVSIILLDPFNVQFYKNMGFGYGTKVYKYMVKPDAFPKGNSKENLIYLNKEEHEELLRDCYNRVYKNTHGLIEKQEYELNNIFDDRNIIIGSMKEGVLQGYLAFTFKKVKNEYTYQNNMIVQEIIYETPEALGELCTFIHSQLDQVQRVIMNMNDEYLEFILSDPTNGLNDGFNTMHCEVSVTGIGKMYRTINLERLMEELKAVLTSTVNFKLKVNIHDNLVQAVNKSVVLNFKDGETYIEDDEYDVEVTIDVSDFSSLILGVIPFSRLIKNGRATISDKNYITAVSSVFTECHPMCLTEF